MVDVGTDGQAVVKDELGGVLGKAHAARQVLKRDQHGVALLKEALQKPALACVGLGVGLKQTVDGLVTACIQAGVKQAAVVIEHQRQLDGAVWSTSRSVKNTARLNENDR